MFSDPAARHRSTSAQGTSSESRVLLPTEVLVATSERIAHEKDSRTPEEIWLVGDSVLALVEISANGLRVRSIGLRETTHN